jgi:Tfp pilus assembly protein PilV
VVLQLIVFMKKESIFIKKSYLSPRRAASGLSLIEVLLILVLISATIVGFMMVVSQNRQSAKGMYLESSRSLLFNSLLSEMSVDRPTFGALFTDSSMNTGTSESGQTLPYRRVVDLTNSGVTNSMKRTTHFYLYNNSTDSASAPRYRTAITQSTPILRMRFGNTDGLIDNAGNYWFGDSNIYSSSNEVPGMTVTNSRINRSGNDITNTSGNDDALFQYYQRATDLYFNADVDNGSYTVNLYFCEAGEIGSTRRLMNIFLEGKRMNLAPYSPLDSTGALYRAEIKSYDTEVTDGTLNVQISKDPNSSDNSSLLNAIEIKKRIGP